MPMITENRRTVVRVEVTDAEKRRSPSKHYSYVMKVGWSDESETIVYRRYSKFFEFQIILLETFPYEGGLKDPSLRIIPFLPGKILFRRSHVRDVAMKRLKPIDVYCKALVKLPARISHCDHVLDFFEPHQEDLNPREDASRRRRNEDQDIGEISGPLVLEQYLAIADYVGTQVKELNITVGQRLEVIEKNENGWWFVSNDEGERGWVPGVYLEKPDGSVEDLVTNRAELGQGEHYVTTHAYTAENAEDISFGAGVIVEVLQKNLEGWWLVSLNGKQGNAPASYLEKSHDWVSESKVEIISSIRDLKNHRHSLPADSLTSIGFPSRRILNKSSSSNLQTIPSQSIIADEEPRSPLSPTYKEKTVQPPPKRSSVKRNNNKKRPNAPPPLPPSVTEESVYMTVASFNSNISDGVSFNEEMKVQVLEKSPGGWWYVEIDGNEGWAPASYIEKRETTKPKTIPPSRPGPPFLHKNNSTNSISVNAISVARKTQLTSTSSNPALGNISLSQNQSSLSPAKRPLPPLPISTSFSPSHDTQETYEEVGASSISKSFSECVTSLPTTGAKYVPDKLAQNSQAMRTPPVDFRSVLKSSIAAKHNEIKTRSARSPPRPSKGPKTINDRSKSKEHTNGNISRPQSVNTVQKPTNVQRSNSNSKENNSATVSHSKKPLKPAMNVGPPKLPPKPKSASNSEKAKTTLSNPLSTDNDNVTDFRSVLRSTQRKQSGSTNVVARARSFNSDKLASTKSNDKQTKPPQLPKKPNNLPLKPQVPIKMKGTDEIPDGEENDPKVTSRKPVTKPPWNSGSKPVLRRFQINNNSNVDTVEKKPVFTVGHIKIELKKTPNLSTSLPKRGSPDGQVDNKFQNIVEAILPVVPPKRTTKNPKHPKGSQKPESKLNTPLLNVFESKVKEISASTQCTAISNYSGMQECEISFSCGDTAEVVEKAENNWWYVKIGEKVGWAPSTYFLLSENTDVSERTYVSVDDRQTPGRDSVYNEIESEEPLTLFSSNFVAAADFIANDHSMISFNAGDEITVTEESEGGWWYAVLVNGLGEGWVPSSYFDPA